MDTTRGNVFCKSTKSRRKSCICMGTGTAVNLLLWTVIEQDKKRWKLGKAILIALCAFIAIAFIVMCTL
jgi:hypothetical protein